MPINLRAARVLNLLGFMPHVTDTQHHFTWGAATAGQTKNGVI